MSKELDVVVFGASGYTGKLVVEYEGDSPADYPGDQSDHSIAGYTYDVRE